MTTFPGVILDHWLALLGDGHGDRLPAVTEALDAKRPAMMLEVASGPSLAAVSPDVARRIGLGEAEELTVDALRGRLDAAGVALHDPDQLFYRPVGAPPPRQPAAAARALAEADRPAFDRFLRQAPERDREEASVELDHPGVAGCFSGEQLVSAASLCLWKDGLIADLGVLTLPDARGRGFGTAAVAAVVGMARKLGREPQYRCQVDNRASAALAARCGFALFGRWTVSADPSP